MQWLARFEGTAALDLEERLLLALEAGRDAGGQGGSRGSSRSARRLSSSLVRRLTQIGICGSICMTMRSRSFVALRKDINRTPPTTSSVPASRRMPFPAMEFADLLEAEKAKKVAQ